MPAGGPHQRVGDCSGAGAGRDPACARSSAPVGAVPGVHAGWLRPGRSPRRSGEAERRRVSTGACQCNDSRALAHVRRAHGAGLRRTCRPLPETSGSRTQAGNVRLRAGKASPYRLVPRQRTVRALHRFRIGRGRGSGICGYKVEAIALPLCASGRTRPTIGQTAADSGCNSLLLHVSL